MRLTAAGPARQRPEEAARFVRQLALGCLACILPALAEAADTPLRYEEDALAAARRALAAARDRPLALTGSVTDLDGQPLPGVAIAALVARYEPDRLDDPYLTSASVTTETDADGRFTIRMPAAQFLSLMPPFKEGYEFRPEWSEGAIFERHPDGAGVWADLQPEAAPVVLRLRKRGAGTYLLTFDEGYSDVSGERRLLGVHMTPSDVTYVGSPPSKEPYDPLKGLELAVESCGSYTTCTLKATIPADAGAGILRSERFLAEAPADGYLPSVSFVAGPRTVHYLYVRTGNPTLYARMELTIYAKDGSATISSLAYVNPFGKRNLERSVVPLPGIGQAIYDSLQNGRVPDEPDFTAATRLEEEGRRRMADKWKAMTKALLVPIDFYGRVVDDGGRPVEGAEIGARLAGPPDLDPMRWRPPKPFHRAHTDREGRFAFEGLTGASLTIEAVRKLGYEFDRRANPDDHHGYSDPGRKGGLPSRENPATFVLRRRGEPAVLVWFSGDLRLDEKQPGAWLDFFGARRVGRTASPPPLNGEPFIGDLAVTAERLPEAAGWRVTFRAPGSGGGVALDTRRFYEAPDSRLAPEVSAVLQRESSGRAPLHLVVASRTPTIYSAVEIRPHVSAERVSLSVEGHANPFGERSLEEAPVIPGFTVDFVSRAQRLICSGKRPEKPNLPALMEEAARKAAQP